MLKIKPEILSQIQASLVGVIERAVVRNGIFFRPLPMFLSLGALDGHVPEKSNLSVQLEEYVSDHPLSIFVFDMLSSMLSEKGEFSEDDDGKNLTDVPGFEDANAVASLLISELKTLPWAYVNSFKLPSDFSSAVDPNISRLSLSNSVRLVRVDEQLGQEMPYAPGNSLLLAAQGRRSGAGAWDIGQVFLQIDTKGFLDSAGTTMPLFHAEQTLKSFYGMGLALRLFNLRQGVASSEFGSTIVTHRQLKTGYEQGRVLDLKGSYSGIEMCATTDAKSNAKTVSDALSKMGSVFSKGKNGEAILLASQWLFDSYSGRDELLQFVQAMIVLEILLGNKSKGGADALSLGQLLKNRCAYLIGRTREQRERLLGDFTKIYDVRSAIVHRGKHKLSRDEKELFRKLHWICGRVIEEEINLLMADRKS